MRVVCFDRGEACCWRRRSTSRGGPHAVALLLRAAPPIPDCARRAGRVTPPAQHDAHWSSLSFPSLPFRGLYTPHQMRMSLVRYGANTNVGSGTGRPGPGEFYMHGTTHRFTPRSCCCLAESNKLRKAAVWLMTWVWFDRFILFLILVNSLMIAATDYGVVEVQEQTYDLIPAVCGWWTRSPFEHTCSVRNMINDRAEPVFTAFFLIESAAKIIGMGFICGKGTYLNDAYVWREWREEGVEGEAVCRALSPRWQGNPGAATDVSLSLALSRSLPRSLSLSLSLSPDGIGSTSLSSSPASSPRSHSSPTSPCCARSASFDRSDRSPQYQSYELSSWLSFALSLISRMFSSSSPLCLSSLGFLDSLFSRVA